MIFDGHSDFFTDVLRRRLAGETQVLAQNHLPRLRGGGIEGGCFVLWVDPPYTNDYTARTEDWLREIALEMNACQDAVLVRNLSDIERAKAEGKFYILMGIEGLSVMGEDLDVLDRLYDFGARHAMLTWNEENLLATGVRGASSRGLTLMGKRTVQHMEEKGMVVDVSHLNEPSFWDVMDLAHGPIVASHSNARVLADVARNLSDEQLRVLAQTDGLVGINAFHEFVNDDIEKRTIDGLVEQAVYIADKIGTRHLALGFDFLEFLATDIDGTPREDTDALLVGLENCTKVPLFLEKLRQAGFAQAEVEDIAENNWQRILADILK